MVNHLSQDVFQAVRQAEAAAAEALQEAQKQAREVLKKAESDCAASERAAAQDARTLYQTILDDRRKHTDEDVLARQEQVNAEQEAELSKAKANLAQAADLIYKRVIEHGNS